MADLTNIGTNILPVSGAAIKLIDRAPIVLSDPRSLSRRDKLRTMSDVYRQFIQPQIGIVAEAVGAKTVFHAKTTHEFQNRTGALEDTMRWKVTAPSVDSRDVEITAGGLGRVQFPLRESKAKTKRLGPTATGRSRRTRRRGQIVERAGRFSSSLVLIQQSERQGLKSGQIINVDYARKVEMRGFSVLKNSVALYARITPRILRKVLRRSTGRLPVG